MYAIPMDPQDAPSLTHDEVNLVEQAIEEFAREEAESNETEFSEYVCGGMVNLSDVSVILSNLAKGTEDSCIEAKAAADRIIDDWVRYRVDSMPQHERAEIERRVLERDLEEERDDYEAPEIEGHTA